MFTEVKFYESYFFAMDSKLVVKKALTLQELPDHGLTRGQIAILMRKMNQLNVEHHEHEVE